LGPTTHTQALSIAVPGSACCQPGLQIYLLTLCGDIAIPGKVAYLGNVDFCVEDKSAIHGTVALHAKWPAMATMPSLAKLHCKHQHYHAGVIAGCAGVITFGTSHCSQHCAGIWTLSRWRIAIIVVASLPL
jgi:hypothetical protein